MAPPTAPGGRRRLVAAVCTIVSLLLIVAWILTAAAFAFIVLAFPCETGDCEGGLGLHELLLAVLTLAGVGALILTAVGAVEWSRAERSASRAAGAAGLAALCFVAWYAVGFA